MTSPFHVEFHCKTCGISEFVRELMISHVFHEHDEHVAVDEKYFIVKIYHCTKCPFNSKSRRSMRNHFIITHTQTPIIGSCVNGEQ